MIHYRGSEGDAARLEEELNALRPQSARRVKADLLAPIALGAARALAPDGKPNLLWHEQDLSEDQRFDFDFPAL